MSLYATTWQTVGPYFHVGFAHMFGEDVAGEGVRGERVYIEGCIFDGAGKPIPDAVLEIWQANAEGKYAHPEDRQDKLLEQRFRGFARIPTDEHGRFRMTTIKPGIVPGPGDKEQAPHLVVGLLMRGLLKGMNTRAYFPNEILLATDPILQRVEPERRSTLILQRSTEQSNHFCWEIRMQGKGETVFFEF